MPLPPRLFCFFNTYPVETRHVFCGLLALHPNRRDNTSTQDVLDILY
jgi:hypothetical protein